MNDSFEITPLLDHLAGVIREAGKLYDAEGWEGDARHRYQAFIVLQTPEMQAIRCAFRSAWGSDIESAPVSLTRNLRQSGLPESVVRWVVEAQ